MLCCVFISSTSLSCAVMSLGFNVWIFRTIATLTVFGGTTLSMAYFFSKPKSKLVAGHLSGNDRMVECNQSLPFDNVYMCIASDEQAAKSFIIIRL